MSYPQAREYVERAVKFGDFTLASGKQSNVYVDMKQVLLDAECAADLAGCILDGFLSSHPCDCIGGHGIGGALLVSHVLSVCHFFNIPMKGFVVRDQVKDHGTRSLVQGPVQPGDCCYILEDVTTTGQSAQKAIIAAEEFGLKVYGVVTLLDREEGAAAFFAESKMRFESMFRLSDLDSYSKAQ